MKTSQTRTPPDGIRPGWQADGEAGGKIDLGRAASGDAEHTGLAFRELTYPLATSLLTLGELELAYSDSGRGQRTLLLLHGLASYLPAWSRNIPALSARCRVVALDLPGFGQSTKGPEPGRYTMAAFAQVIEEVIGRLGLTQVVLCGHSMGAQVALTHALRFPERAQALVLVAPAGFERFSPTEGRYLRLAVTPESVRDTPPAGVHANLEYNFFAMPKEARFMAEDRIRVIGGPDFGDYCQAVSASVQGMLDAPVFDRLGEVAVPVLAVFGEQDRLIPNPVLHPGTTRAVAEAGVQRLPRGRLVMVPQAGHMVHFERPEVVDQAILDFLSHLQA